jgi:ATP-binding cassette subfamily B protein
MMDRSVLRLVRAACRALRPYRIQGVLLLPVLLLGLTWIALNPQIYPPLLDHALVHRDANQVVLLTGLMLTFALLDFAGMMSLNYLSARLGAAMARDLRMLLFSHLQRLPLAYFAGRMSGDLLAGFTADLEAVESAFTGALPRACLFVLQVLCCVLLLFRENWRLALLSLLLVPVVYVIPRLLGPRVRSAATTRQHDVGQLAGTIQENITSQPVVRAFGLQGHALAQATAHANRLAKSSFDLAFLTNTLGAVTGISASIFQVALIGVAAELIVHGVATTGTLYAFYLYLTYGVQAVQSLVLLGQPCTRRRVPWSA